jgi:hypothetical protein
MAQPDLEGEIVQGADADTVGIGHLAGVPVLGADDARVDEERGVLGGDLGIQDALPGVLEVGRGDRLTVAPAAVGPQVEGIGQAVSRNVVVGRGGRLRREPRIEAQQRLEHLADDGRFGGETTSVRVDVVRFTLQRVDSQLLGLLLRKHRMRRGGDKQRERREQGNQTPHHGLLLISEPNLAESGTPEAKQTLATHMDGPRFILFCLAGAATSKPSTSRAASRPSGDRIVAYVLIPMQHRLSK